MESPTFEPTSKPANKLTPVPLIFLDEVMNNDIFREYLGYENRWFLGKDLLKVNWVKNNQIKNQVIYSINELKNAVIR